ncbi:MAG: S1C family serine protease [Culicoidibacterales bacterium]
MQQSTKGFLAGIIGGTLASVLAIGGFLWMSTNNSTIVESIQQSVSVDVSTQTTQVVEEVSPAVVGVINLQTSQTSTNLGPFGNLLPQSGSAELQEVGSGSGVIYKKDGNTAYVVTNAHVIDAAEQIEVVMTNGDRYVAELVGSDAINDLAVLKMSAEGVSQIAELGDSDSVRVGEPVIAIGNPLGLDFYGSVTSGIISGKERALATDNGAGEIAVLQTDAAINPGNSGGALLNIQGQVIGINSAKISSEYAEGIAFAIPINTAKSVITQLETNGKVEYPVLGVTLQSLESIPLEYRNATLELPSDVQSGVLVIEAQSDYPAANAGIKSGDVITEFNGQAIASVLDLKRELLKLKVGDQAELTYYRDSTAQTVTVKLTKAQ